MSVEEDMRAPGIIDSRQYLFIFYPIATQLYHKNLLAQFRICYYGPSILQLAVVFFVCLLYEVCILSGKASILTFCL